METTQQYPEWQTVIRQKQVEERAADEIRMAQQDAENRAWNIKKINQMREDLAECGLVLPESETGVWKLDDYTLSVRRTSSYEDILTIEKSVPDAVHYDEGNDGLWASGYRDTVSKTLYIRSVSGGDIADVIDEIDNLAIQQVETNKQVVATAEERKSQPQLANPEPEPPSPESLLLSAIREMIREELAIRDAAIAEIY